MPVRGAPLVSVEANWLQAVTLRPLGIEISVTSTKDCQPPPAQVLCPVFCQVVTEAWFASFRVGA